MADMQNPMPGIPAPRHQSVMPRSIVGGPSGPGGSPMVSPGTGAGVQASAAQAIKGVMKTLAGFLKVYDPGTPEYNAIITSIKGLNAVFHAKSSEKNQMKPPVPFPATPPGSGLGGMPPPQVASALSGAGLSPGISPSGEAEGA